ncbi:hypothetical protein EIN_173820 [Entamoeba invadens IP1]|uniref:Uncharacterized protein n=1 Tax=Entamoeba invadens IP1 TaxID=370355 RepID=A0A0A1TW23_ENTIV|nr:hypothetical protein EIN_173820 [Entamoeba invadens IP1]ELP84707.1 hypothetical protein EIN_173820 [Entamoeba invadens IP1]|eukprot:XP_004184053.1 hypothetical protein EIN_173820 [Entamoeba invadens IP1]
MCEIKGHNSSVTSVNFSLTDSNILCSGDANGIFRIWDLRTKKTTKAYQFPTKTDITSSQCFDEKCYISSENNVHLFDLRVGGLFMKTPLFTTIAEDDVNKIKVDKDHEELAFCDDSGSVTVLKVSDNTITSKLSHIHQSVCPLQNNEHKNETHTHLCSDIVFDINKKVVYTSGLDMTVMKSLYLPSQNVLMKSSFKNTTSNTLVNPPMAHSIDLNGRGTQLLVACGDGSVYWLNTGDLKVNRKFEISLGMAQQALYYNHDSLYLFATPNELQCRSNVFEMVFARNFCKINDVAANDKTRQIAVADHSCDIHFFETAEEEEC